MTLNDIEGHLGIARLTYGICGIFLQFTLRKHHAVPRRQLSFLYFEWLHQHGMLKICFFVDQAVCYDRNRHDKTGVSFCLRVTSVNNYFVFGVSVKNGW